MATTIKKQKFDEAADYVTVTQYIRRKHALMLEKDKLARPLYPNSIKSAITRGDIIPYNQNGILFIDWNKYKNVLFRQYGEMPKPAVKTKRA